MSNTDFGIIGLGVMGKSISLNIAEKGFKISVYNRAEGDEKHVVDDFIIENNSFKNIKGFTDLDTFVNSIEKPRKILLMIPAGKPVDTVINRLMTLLSEEDCILDGGNSHYLNTKKRFELLKSKNFAFLGVGISGGEAGARKGPSIMPGGSKEGYKNVSKILETVAARDFKGNPCCTYIGPEGAGHYIKMVHNGIEYAEMQLLAELFALLSLSMGYEKISEVFSSWNDGHLSNYLLEIMTEILLKKEGDEYVIDLILDKAGNKGTGSWSSTSALELGVPNTMMTAAVFARYISSFKEKRVSFSKRIESQYKAKPNLNIEDLKNAYQSARIVNHHQGFELINEASKNFDWNLNLSEIARIWTNGCIIKSNLMEHCVSVFMSSETLLDDISIFISVSKNEQSIATVLTKGISTRIALPCFQAAYNYWVSLTTDRLPANIIQAQRDYFGAHTYQRIDNPLHKFFHTNW